MTDYKAMIKAIGVAEKKATPYGCCILDSKKGDYLTAANSSKIEGKTAHAEMNALRRLHELRDFDPSDLILYSTAEPCPMCMSAIIWCGITQVKFGIDIETIKNYNKQILISAQEVASRSWLDVKIERGLLRERNIDLIKKFTNHRRS